MAKLLSYDDSSGRFSFTLSACFAFSNIEITDSIASVPCYSSPTGILLSGARPFSLTIVSRSSRRVFISIAIFPTNLIRFRRISRFFDFDSVAVRGPRLSDGAFSSSTTSTGYSALISPGVFFDKMFTNISNTFSMTNGIDQVKMSMKSGSRYGCWV
jgi:hypothetical protein